MAKTTAANPATLLGDARIIRHRGKIEASIATLREAMQGEDAAVIESAVQNLNTAAHKLAEAMYAKAAAQAGAPGGDGAQAGAGSQDAGGGQTVDADFEVVDDEKK